MYLTDEKANQFSGGIFMIGLAILFLTGDWWPGILFVIGASSIAQGLVRGRGWYSLQGSLWMIGLGLVFVFGFSLPLLFLLIGGSMVFGSIFKPPFMEKEKNTYYEDEDEEDIYIDRQVDVFDPDEYEQPKRKNL